MFVACWSAKGGSGTTVVAAALALVLARSSEGGALLVDLAGDLPAVLGLPEPEGPGLTGWFAAGTSVPPDGLARLRAPVAEAMMLLPRGPGSLEPATRSAAFVQGLGDLGSSVVIDCGTLGPFPGEAPGAEVRRRVAQASPERLVVTRPCYLSLRR
ncbi:MAG TPA: hypothetical protein VIJ47_00730, partial [Acidimicrobiales bacterium]